MAYHVEQARHNLALLDDLDERFPNDYFDWKLTILFYAAFHYLKALAAKRKVNIGDNHKEIIYNIRPPKPGQYPAMPVQRTAFSNYNSLMQYSWQARYDGHTDRAVFAELRKTDYPFARQCFDQFRSYVQGQGVTV